MSAKSTVDILFKEHSYEEIESVRDNLANEIEKRNELLKSIVKEKYRDVVETSDAIQSMKVNLTKLEQSMRHLDSSVANFYKRIEETNKYSQQSARKVESGRGGHDASVLTSFLQDDTIDSCDNQDIQQVLSKLTELWDHLDSGNLKLSVKLYHDCVVILGKCRNSERAQQESIVLENLDTKLRRAEEMIKNFLWHKIQSVETNQICIIADNNEKELYSWSLRSSIEFLVKKLREDISDVTYPAQIRRYQQYSHFNTSTNTVDNEVNDIKPPSSDYVQIPKEISLELSAFLFATCRVLNTIAGFSLTRSSIIDSLKVTVLQILNVYTDLVAIIDTLSSGSKRRRAMQLYFDLMYVRVLLNTSKDLELIEDLDPKISELMSKFEQMLDTIELYVVSDALHTNVLHLSKSTIRLYGLLVPHLQ